MVKDTRAETAAELRERARLIRQLMRCEILSAAEYDRLRVYAEDLESQAAEAELKHAPAEPVIGAWWRRH